MSGLRDSDRAQTPPRETCTRTVRRAKPRAVQQAAAAAPAAAAPPNAKSASCMFYDNTLKRSLQV